jgi:hypothetical protein
VLRVGVGGLVTGSDYQSQKQHLKHQQGAVKIPAETVGFIGLFHGFILCSASSVSKHESNKIN